MNTKILVLVAALSFFVTACESESTFKAPAQSAAPTPVPASETPAEPLPPQKEVIPQPKENWEEEVELVDPLLNADLLAMQLEETAGLQLSEVLALNEKEFQKVESLPTRVKRPNSRGHRRVTAITPEMGQKVIQSINDHEIVAEWKTDKYDQKDVKIGYCFGRATYVHLALLKMGVDKQSIRKIWIVGPMISGGISWQFHVATIVKSTTGEWIVLDSFTGKVMNMRDWVNNFMPMNQGFNNLRVYITNPSKFSVSLAKYDRIQLGLDMPADKDWYKNYFVDLMKWFQDHKLEDIGLYDLRKEQPEQSESKEPVISANAG